MQEPLYVVENILTGEKKVLPYSLAVLACYNEDPYFDIWHCIPNPDLKMYPLEDVSAAAKVLFGKGE